MSYRALGVLVTALVTVLVATPVPASAQGQDGVREAGPLPVRAWAVPPAPSAAPALAPSPAAAALLPHRAPLRLHPHARGNGQEPVHGSGPRPAHNARPWLAPAAEPGPSLLVTAAILAGASFGGLWAGAQIPFAPADDDSDLSVWHLLTAPTASVVTVTLASRLLGNDLSSSLRGALLGAGAGVGAALLASMTTDDTGILLTYAGVHGLVSALTTR